MAHWRWVVEQGSLSMVSRMCIGKKKGHETSLAWNREQWAFQLCRPPLPTLLTCDVTLGEEPAEPGSLSPVHSSPELMIP
jgi:hypothetical protein